MEEVGGNGIRGKDGGKLEKTGYFPCKEIEGWGE